MLKYAFIANSETMSPDKYHYEYDSDDMKFRFFAVNNMDMTKKCAAGLADEDFEYIDLCGDFDAEKAQEVADARNGKISVEYAKYSEEDDEKFENLEKINEYALIVMTPGLAAGTIKMNKLTCPEFNTTITLVSDDEAAGKAAKDLVTAGIDFIELCSYFDEDKTNGIRKAIDGKVPVGSCG